VYRGRLTRVNAPSMFRATLSMFLFVAGPGECSVRMRVENKQSSVIVKLLLTVTKSEYSR
jgi:hypothetical protein